MANPNPFLTWLRNLGRDGEPQEAAGEAPVSAPEPVPSEPAPEVFRLDLPPEHAVRKLRALWVEQSGWQPAPEFAFSEVGAAISPAAAARELGRLKLSVNASANARLKHLPSVREGADGPVALPDLDARVEIFVTSDALSAWVYVYPPVGKGAELTREALAAALSQSKVVFGVDEALLDSLPGDPQRYFRLFPIARGRPAQNGGDGRIIDLFSRKPERKLKVDEFNRVDYASLSFIQNAAEGDPICRVIPPTPGEPGSTVLGKPIPARDGAAVSAPKGRNTALSEDGTTLYAAITGHVEFSGRAFQVKPVLEVPGSVDFSTGNINFLGDVHIHGDVCTGFSVRAMGSVTVDGVVEAGTVEAGRDLIVVKGAQGDSRAVLRASRSVFAKYLENCCVYAVEDLHADCLINCDVYCGGAVEVTSGRGAIIGGSVRCAHEVTAGVVGSRAECSTQISLGGLPCQEFDREILTREIAGLEEELEKVELQPESPTRFTRLGKLRMQLSLNKSKLEQYQLDLEEEEDGEEEPGVRRLTCGVAYPGAAVEIGGAVYLFRHETRPVTAYLDTGGNIQIT